MCEVVYIGRYQIIGDRIEYWDDIGFMVDGCFVDGVLYYVGMVMICSE